MWDPRISLWREIRGRCRRRFDRTRAKALTNKGDFMFWVNEELTPKHFAKVCDQMATGGKRVDGVEHHQGVHARLRGLWRDPTCSRTPNCWVSSELDPIYKSLLGASELPLTPLPPHSPAANPSAHGQAPPP